MRFGIYCFIVLLGVIITDASNSKDKKNTKSSLTAKREIIKQEWLLPTPPIYHQQPLFFGQQQPQQTFSSAFGDDVLKGNIASDFITGSGFDSNQFQQQHLDWSHQFHQRLPQMYQEPTFGTFSNGFNFNQEYDPFGRVHNSPFAQVQWPANTQDNVPSVMHQQFTLPEQGYHHHNNYRTNYYGAIDHLPDNLANHAPNFYGAFNGQNPQSSAISQSSLHSWFQQNFGNEAAFINNNPEYFNAQFWSGQHTPLRWPIQQLAPIPWQQQYGPYPWQNFAQNTDMSSIASTNLVPTFPVVQQPVNQSPAHWAVLKDTLFGQWAEQYGSWEAKGILQKYPGLTILIPPDQILWSYLSTGQPWSTDRRSLINCHIIPKGQWLNVEGYPVLPLNQSQQYISGNTVKVIKLQHFEDQDVTLVWVDGILGVPKVVPSCGILGLDEEIADLMRAGLISRHPKDPFLYVTLFYDISRKELDKLTKSLPPRNTSQPLESLQWAAYGLYPINDQTISRNQVLSIDGTTLIIEGKNNKWTVNGLPIIQTNIATQWGIVHIISNADNDQNSLNSNPIISSPIPVRPPLIIVSEDESKDMDYVIASPVRPVTENQQLTASNPTVATLPEASDSGGYVIGVNNGR